MQSFFISESIKAAHWAQDTYPAGACSSWCPAGSPRHNRLQSFLSLKEQKKEYKTAVRPHFQDRVYFQKGTKGFWGNQIQIWLCRIFAFDLKALFGGDLADCAHNSHTSALLLQLSLLHFKLQHRQKSSAFIPPKARDFCEVPVLSFIISWATLCMALTILMVLNSKESMW